MQTLKSDYEKRYPEETKILNDIYVRYNNLIEEDISGAFQKYSAVTPENRG